MQVVPFLAALERGYAVASINYRMSGESIFPAAVRDCKCSVRYLRANASLYGLDPSRFAVAGGSAGGCFSVMVAATSGVAFLEDFSQGYKEVSSSVQACVDWFDPTDFLRMDEQLEQMGLGPCDHNDTDSPESSFMGGDITTLGAEVMARSNPITYISDRLPPLFIQHGENNHLVCMLQSQILYEAIVEKLGQGRAVFEVIEDADHADVHFSMPENMERVFGFLDNVLQPEVK